MISFSLLVFKNSTNIGFLALGFNWEAILGPREEKFGSPC
jgi:hypothetical protein